MRSVLSRSVLVLSGLGLGVTAGASGHLAGGDSEFDRLTEADREVFSARFRKDLWSLFTRNGKDGCAGCHDPRHRSGLRFTGKADADFRAMLRDGFLLPDDPGGILKAVSTTNPRRRMPPDDRPGWSAEEIARLRAFVKDLDKKQQKD